MYLPPPPSFVQRLQPHAASQAGLLLLNMVISIISEGLAEILDNDLKDEEAGGAPRCHPPTHPPAVTPCAHIKNSF